MDVFIVSMVVWTLMFWSTTNVASGTVQLDFRVTPAVVQPLETRNVTLQCLVNEVNPFYGNQQHRQHYHQNGHYVTRSNNQPNEHKSAVAMIRIVKNLQNQWEAIAQISNIAPTLVHKLDSSVSSFKGVISDDLTQRSFIQVSWDLATADAFGTYRCDAISFDSYQNAILTTSSQLPLGSALNALDLLRLLKHDMTDVRNAIHSQHQDQKSGHNLTAHLQSELHTQEKKTERKHKELDEKLSQQGDLLEAEFERIKNRIDGVESEITNKLQEVDSKIDIIIQSGFLMVWPRGSYGLLQPESGCPVGGATSWETGWVRHHTESTDRNKDELSPMSHIGLSVLGKSGVNNYVVQQFCVKTSPNLLGPNWPSGSYCINKKGNCPDRFNEGHVTWDEEDDLMLTTSGGQLPDVILNGTETGTTTVSYCCRQDGPADVPIYLPNSDPFYLYRYGGKCQQIRGMNVSEEFIIFDTENTENCDEYGEVHPDGTIKNVRLELCYYTKI